MYIRCIACSLCVVCLVVSNFEDCYKNLVFYCLVLTSRLSKLQPVELHCATNVRDCLRLGLYQQSVPVEPL